jgi:hypothetical protein
MVMNRSVKILGVVLAAGMLFTAAAGCETAGGNMLLSEIYGANARLEPNPRKAAALQAISNVTAWEANRQAVQGQ